MRTIIEVPEATIRSLDRLGKQQKKSRAAIIRKAIDMYLEKEALPIPDSAFGLWKANAQDGLKYQEQLRSEWG